MERPLSCLAAKRFRSRRFTAVFAADVSRLTTSFVHTVARDSRWPEWARVQRCTLHVRPRSWSLREPLSLTRLLSCRKTTTWWAELILIQIFFRKLICHASIPRPKSLAVTHESGGKVIPSWLRTWDQLMGQ